MCFCINEFFVWHEKKEHGEARGDHASGMLVGVREDDAEGILTGSGKKDHPVGIWVGVAKIILRKSW